MRNVRDLQATDAQTHPDEGGNCFVFYFIPLFMFIFILSLPVARTQILKNLNELGRGLELQMKSQLG